MTLSHAMSFVHKQLQSENIQWSFEHKQLQSDINP